MTAWSRSSRQAERRSPAARRRRAGLAAAATAVALLVGCAGVGEHVGYYWQSATGHLALVGGAQPIDELLARSDLDPELQRKLAQVREIRAFASRELGLPENGSYTRYADLKRPYAVWNVFATPELSMRLERWCFPIAGCVGYRGYYSREAAESYAQQLRAAGLEVYVAGVPAYSTLGWFDDPVLSTFVHYPEPELARLIFHELSHQLLYVRGDTTFNESFATAVEQAGVERWLAARGDPQLVAEFERHAQRRRDFVALLRRYRTELDAMYREDIDDATKRQRKREIFDALQQDYRRLRRDWGGYAGFDRWFAQPLTNAHLASVGAYTDLVPAFRALLERHDGDLQAFYREARSLAGLPKDERMATLRQMAAPRRTADASR